MKLGLLAAGFAMIIIGAPVSAYFVRAQLILSRSIHMHISTDKRDIAGGQAEEVGSDEDVKGDACDRTPNGNRQQEDSKVEAQTLNDVCYYYLIIALTLITCNMLYMAGHLSSAIARISCSF